MQRLFYRLMVVTIVLMCQTLLYAQQGANFGFWGYDISRSQTELTPQRREEIKAEIQQNVTRLKAQGKLTAYEPRAAVLFSLPLKASSTLKDYGFYGISAFVDHDPTYPNHLLDYNCGTRTYDLSSGANHQGTDIFPWPFGWKKMDNNEVVAVAAAAGTIVNKEDGNYDRNCAMGDANWNAVYVRHSDGSTAWYGHFKKGSLTTKVVGDTVEEGEFLGVVGSSGGSTGPHLHFELYDSASKLNDPFSGNCNKMNSFSWWKSQRPYYDPSVLKLMTSAVQYTETECPITETTNEKTSFQAGDTVYFYIFYRDLLQSMESTYTIYRPDGTVFKSWMYKYDKTQYYSVAYWYWYYTLPTDAPAGKWRFQMIDNGQTYEQAFNVGTVAGVNLTVTKTGSGSGTVASSPSGIDCRLTCTASFSSGASVTLTATADTGSTIKAWTGCDSTPTANQCVVAMTADKGITVEFTASAGKKVKNDFDGDGHSDVLWRNTKTGDVYIWLMDGTGTKIKSANLVINAVPADWDIKATEDFDGDGKTDLLWQNNTTGDVVIWFMDGSKIASSGYVARAVPSNWRIQATADYNGDGKTDLLWQDTITGDVYVQLIDGLKISGGDFVTRGLPGDWQTK
ncbi:MAG: peptidoglycan DD-metalloendopeptidase family protein [Nitrospirae bacterium]|nr:peptidoglycan DD-metalloendopeptidase family protein [Nitrospirota bacterium]MBF0590899.1 peptidoglycan DD-metalloendopeptidase family protein [Nitrospirota bacterium]